MTHFTPTPHHDVLVLLVQIAVLLGTARVLGEIATRLRQPAVVGELLAGILLGPSFLSTLLPVVGEWILPPTPEQGHLLEVVSLIGAMLLLLITGLETDIALIRRHARTAIGVSAGGILVTFVTGFLLGQFLPAFLIANPDQRLVFSLFVATSMSISAIPVIAKVLMDLNLMRRDVGQIILAAGMSDDTTGWIMLSVVAGLASGGAVTFGSVAQAVGSVLLFLILSFTVGRWLVKRLLDYVQDEAISANRVLTLVMVLMLVWGAITHSLGLEAVLGAFVMGILFSQMRRLSKGVIHTLESVTLGLFAPVFFAVAGLKVNLLNLLNTQLILIAFLVIAVAIGGKVLGTYLGARFIGRQDHWTSLSFGAGLNARGAMEIIVASIGLSLGILTQEMFSIIVLMAMVTSMMAPTALRFVLQRVVPQTQEVERLRREEMAVGSVIANIHRVLIPVRGSSNVAEFAFLMRQMAKQNNISVTLLHIANREEDARTVLEEAGKRFKSMELVKKSVTATDISGAILDEAKKNYDLLILGATQREDKSQMLFSPLIDTVVRLAPCPTMIVKGLQAAEHLPPQRILVPTNGSGAARNAAELGFYLVNGNEAQLAVLNVVTPIARSDSFTPTEEDGNLRFGIAHQITDKLRSVGEAQGVLVNADVREGGSVSQTIVDVASREQIDLIILGTDRRPGTERLYLGPRVEYILDNAPCPVVVFNTASGKG